MLPLSWSRCPNTNGTVSALLPPTSHADGWPGHALPRTGRSPKPRSVDLNMNTPKKRGPVCFPIIVTRLKMLRALLKDSLLTLVPSEELVSVITSFLLHPSTLRPLPETAQYPAVIRVGGKVPFIHPALDKLTEESLLCLSLDKAPRQKNKLFCNSLRFFVF